MEVINLRATKTSNGNYVVIVEHHTADGQLNRYLGQNITIIGTSVKITGGIRLENNPRNQQSGNNSNRKP